MYKHNRLLLTRFKNQTLRQDIERIVNMRSNEKVLWTFGYLLIKKSLKTVLG